MQHQLATSAKIVNVPNKKLKYIFYLMTFLAMGSLCSCLQFFMDFDIVTNFRILRVKTFQMFPPHPVFPPK